MIASLRCCLVACLVFGAIACSDNTDSPMSVNDKLTGETDLSFTKPGYSFVTFFNLSEWFPNQDESVRDTVTVLENVNGDVTLDFRLTIDTNFTLALDTMLGTTALSTEMKRAIIDTYLGRYGATLDTTDKDNMRITARPQLRVTSEGIQDYISSRGNTSQPFTIIRYSMKVGDSWSFVTPEGTTLSRRVVHHSSEEDYWVGFLGLKVFKTEETTPDDPLVEKIVWVTNHKFGLVGIHLHLKNGKEVPIKFL